MDHALISIESSSNPDVKYKIEVTFCNNEIQITCTCPAAKNGMLCKHRKGVIKGTLAIRGQDEEVSKARKMIEVAMLREKLDKMETELFPLETEYRELIRKKGLMEERMNELKHSFRHIIDNKTKGALKWDDRWEIKIQLHND